MKRNLLMIMMLSGALAMGAFASTTNSKPGDNAGQSPDALVAARAIHEIRMYPRYTIWDNINLRVRDGNVELTGQVSQPYKKSDLTRLMQRVPGVTSVTNRVEVLPLSNFDDQLRVRVARAIYRDQVLSRYAIQPVPPIHIIVRNGHVTLEGVVNNEMEKNVAFIRASGAGLSFGAVQNNLRVENPKSHS